jgi:dihydroneopterin aldolase
MTVVKLGGGVLPHAGHFESALAALGEAARERPLLIVPGGGPFADTVRKIDREYHLPPAVAHWMAVLAMDQYAHLLASRLPGSVLVAGSASTIRCEIESVLSDGLVPVLAPSNWMREVDPLPHSWDVTGDSIAAWVAGELGASHLVLVKPPGAPASGGVDGGAVDPYFARAIPPRVDLAVVSVDRVAALRAALQLA